MGNTKDGGVQEGLMMSAYQVGISGLVTSDPIMPTPRHIATLSAKRTTDFSRIHRRLAGYFVSRHIGY
jgi:hypothetical protein